MKITRLEITNYRGVKSVSTSPGKAGVVARGRNGGGKTTILNAIRAALAGKDVGPDAIRNGADKAEILIDVDDVTIRRAITKKGNTLTVKKGGMEAKAPVKFLADLLGDCAIDPLDLLLKKKDERKAVVLSALPIEVTREQLDAWAPGLPTAFSVEGHGLDVVGKAHDHFYAVRKEANLSAKTATTEAERLAGLVGQVPDACSLPEAVEAFRVAQAELATAEAEARAFLASQDRARESTEKASKLQVEADAIALSDVNALRVNADEAARIVHELTTQLEKAKDVWGSATLQLNKATEAARQKDSLGREIAALLQSAPAGTMPDVNAARVKLETAEAAGKSARARDEALKAKATADAAKVTAEKATAEAKRLDAIVRTMADDAPAALLKASNGIPGLTLLGDDVAWQGVALGSLCGAEQVRICVEISRRLNARAKILVVDGLERLDPEQLDVFLAEATRDDWQLIASRVDRGDVVIEAIEAEEAAAAE